MPRTQTNDQTLALSGFPVSFWPLKNLFVGQVLIQNNNPNSIFVVTNIDVVNHGNATGNQILIGGLTNTAGLFGAATGTGIYDTFSWRGFLPLTFGQSLSVIDAGSGWDSIGAGFVIANTLTALG